MKKIVFIFLYFLLVLSCNTNDSIKSTESNLIDIEHLDLLTFLQLFRTDHRLTSYGAIYYPEEYDFKVKSYFIYNNKEQLQYTFWGPNELKDGFNPQHTTGDYLEFKYKRNGFIEGYDVRNNGKIISPACIIERGNKNKIHKKWPSTSENQDFFRSEMNHLFGSSIPNYDASRTEEYRDLFIYDKIIVYVFNDSHFRINNEISFLTKCKSIEYDKKANIISLEIGPIYYSPEESKDFNVKILMSESGLISEIDIFQDSNLFTYSKYKYNKLGILTEILTYSSDDNLLVKKYFEWEHGKSNTLFFWF